MSSYVHLEVQGDALVVLPLFTFGRFAEADLFAEWRNLQQRLEDPQVKNVVFDLSKIPYFGSTVLDWMVQMWKLAKSKGGTLVTSNCSEIGQEVLVAARFNTLWSIFPTREQALQALADGTAK